MAILTIDYQIAAGYNNAAGLVKISSITPSSDVPFVDPKGFSGYTPGALKIRGDGTTFYAGYGSTVWSMGYLTQLQYTYLQTTYCGGAGSFAGKVTIKTRIGTATYANYNAILNIPLPSELEFQAGYWLNVPLRFTRMVAL